MNRLRAPALRQIVKTLQARRSGPLDAHQFMVGGHAREFPFDGVVSGAVRQACLGQWNRDVDVIGDEGLGFAGLVRGIFRAHAHFRPTIAGIPRGEHKLPRDGANRGCRNWV